MGLLNYIYRKFVRRLDGEPIFYIIYNPKKDKPNVFTHSVNPDIQQEKRLNELLHEVADEVRAFYEKNPKQLDEILKALEDK